MTRFAPWLVLVLAIGACGTPTQETPTTQAPTQETPATQATDPASSDGPPSASDSSAKEAHEVELARDLPRHRRDEIPVEGATDTALRPILASPLPLILPGTLPASHVWSVDASRVLVSKDASGEVTNYTYFLVADGDPDLEIAVDVGAVGEDAGQPALEDYAPSAPDAGMAAGLVPYRIDSLESVQFIFLASDLGLTIEIFPECHPEENWTIGDGICLTWEELQQIVTTMGVVEP